MADYLSIDGSRVAPGVAAALRVMGAAFRDAFGVELLVTSGTRTHQEQIGIFLSTYRAQASGDGPFGDVRWWQGVRYVRYDPSGTAAQPGTSLHESDRALDLRDSGEDAGVASGGNPRADWLRANAERWGFAPNGYGFGEPWHYEYQLDPWEIPDWAAGKIPATPTKTIHPYEEEDTMPDSMFAVVDGVPSWCWLNWGTGTLFAVHTQEEADWIGGYMGSVKFDWSRDPIGDAKYKNKLALFGMLAPTVKIQGSSLTPTDLARIQGMLNGGARAALTGAV
ncbi:hypothetical protein J2Y69_002299 [Microbacterium resistens]|uniref:D-alanyl-D-alanine carboxypeptidase-like core domain-containing protein n=1 Tax=Microbacterium resistens TaxID=156977 RepID=A0ABU1SDK8_9MICO|nr:M15 family metallopeptidase [Microbacterium resistens]MDR6867695.1 hypothetical protein [Microbacterium resistens]